MVRVSSIVPAYFNCHNTGIPDPLSPNPFILTASTPRGTTGLHSPETKSELKTPAIHTSFATSSTGNQLPAPALAAPSPQITSSSAPDGEPERVNGQASRLQILFEDLHRENAAAGRESDLRVAELHGRIAELVRLENENSEVEQVPPPAYEPDEVLSITRVSEP
jgi:hypothetical protein